MDWKSNRLIAAISAFVGGAALPVASGPAPAPDPAESARGHAARERAESKRARLDSAWAAYYARGAA